MQLRQLIAERFIDVLAPLLVLLGLIIFRIIKKLPKGKGTVTMAILVGGLMLHHLVAGYSDHSMEGAAFRFILLGLAFWLCGKEAIANAKKAIRAIFGGHLRLRVRLMAAWLKLTGGLLQSALYVFVIGQCGIIAGQAYGRLMEGLGNLGDAAFAPAVLAHAIFSVMSGLALWAGGISLSAYLGLRLGRAIWRWNQKRKAAKTKKP